MPGTPTTRFAIPTLGGTDAINTSHTAINNGFGAVDSNMTGYLTGTFAGKPTPNKDGRIYRCTDTGQVLLDNGSAWVELTLKPGLAFSLPGSPYDGQEIYLGADPSNGVVWHLRYRAASASLSKWEFLGGGAMYSEVAATESTANTGYVDLATAGPSITVPYRGDYEIISSVTGSTSSSSGLAALKFGASAAVDADALETTFVSGGIIVAGSRTYVRNMGAVSVKVVYRSAFGTPSFSKRSLTIRPIRVG